MEFLETLRMDLTKTATAIQIHAQLALVVSTAMKQDRQHAYHVLLDGTAMNQVKHLAKAVL
jgi:hypothetical protein